MACRSSSPVLLRSSIIDLESAGGAQAVQRRGAEHVDRAVGDLAAEARFLQAGGDGVAGQVRRQPIVKVVEHDIHRAEIGALAPSRID